MTNKSKRKLRPIDWVGFNRALEFYRNELERLDTASEFYKNELRKIEGQHKPADYDPEFFESYRSLQVAMASSRVETLCRASNKIRKRLGVMTAFATKRVGKSST